MCTFVLYECIDFLHRHTVTHYAFVFINERARNSWVDQFSESKRIAEGTHIHCTHYGVVISFLVEYNMVHGSMTSLLSHVASGPKLTFLYPMTLQLCRFGMQVDTSITLRVLAKTTDCM